MAWEKGFKNCGACGGKLKVIRKPHDTYTRHFKCQLCGHSYYDYNESARKKSYNTMFRADMQERLRRL